ncbi:hypothetical protein GLW07_18980 [Bacillus hwajinpoensis]|uniref:Uncharacterized protein n=1 Tax=Guptibacillus hwajinpoensis TaxID=208199 RepID=A0A845F478_9BACL|nr:hypothetical protein [Pseudalkalibacillus hwajinpoensis]MYL65447.1 hypothetical protein [Pseudalkalibacillus hwajinpoensis]
MNKYGVKKDNMFRFAEKTIVILEGNLKKIQKSIDSIEEEIFNSNSEAFSHSEKILIVYTDKEEKPLLLRAYEVEKTGREAYEGLL